MKLAFVYAGQGSQFAGMGKDLYENYPAARAVFDQFPADFDLRTTCVEDPDGLLNQTRYTQPCMLAVAMAITDILAGNGITPEMTAGLSLGEYSALAAADVLSPQSVLEITALRGRLMAEADPQGLGGMAAILKLEQPQVEALVEESLAETAGPLRIANYNTPAQFVVSGAKAAVTLACSKAKEHKGRGLELKVSGAFHSPLLAEANKELAIQLRKAVWRKPRFPVYSNVTGKAVRDGESARETLLQQMTSPVLWIDVVRHQYADGARRWLELGPKALLGKMVAPCLSGLAEPAQLQIDLVSDGESAAALEN